jgi:hypothetical protein
MFNAFAYITGTVLVVVGLETLISDKGNSMVARTVKCCKRKPADNAAPEAN